MPLLGTVGNVLINYRCSQMQVVLYDKEDCCEGKCSNPGQHDHDTPHRRFRLGMD